MYTAAIILLGILPPALFFMLSKRFNQHGYLHPFTVIGWALIIGYSIKSLYLAYAVNTGAPFRTHLLSSGMIPLGQIAVCFGLGAFVLGFMAMQDRNVAGLSLSWRPRWQPRPEMLYYTVFAASVLLMAIYFYKMDFLDQILNLRFEAAKYFYSEGGIKTSLAFLTIGGDIILVYFIYWLAVSDKITITNIYFPAIVFISVCYMLASRRNGVMLIIAASVMVFALRAARDKVRVKLQHHLLIGLAIVLLTFVSAIRDGGGKKELSDLSFEKAVAASVNHVLQGAYFLDPAKTAVIVGQGPLAGNEFTRDSFTGLLAAPVPRLLWPEKPPVRVGPYVAQEVLKYRNQSGAPPGAVGELFLNFGWLGIFFGMAALGVLTAFVHNLYRNTRDRRLADPIYILFMISVILFLFADFALFALSLARYSLGVFVCAAFWQTVVSARQQSHLLVPVAGTPPTREAVQAELVREAPSDSTAEVVLQQRGAH